MEFISKIKKLLFKEQNVSIINIGNLISIPGRDYFANREDKKDILKQINDYKDSYLKILSKKRKVFINELDNKSLNAKKDMYIKLILNIVMNDEYKDYSNSEVILEYKINSLKLKLYLEEIKKIEDETITRLIALDEIELETIPEKNRNVLIEEINNLKNTLYIFFSQKIAINNEIDSYLNNISISSSNLRIKDVGDRKFETIFYTSLVMDVKDIIKEEELNTIIIPKQIAIIALLETKLEEYVYKNNFDFNRYITTVFQIGNIPNLDFEEAKKMKQELLIELGKLENIYKIYYKYGRNQIDEDDFYQLYSAYFKVLTFDMLEDTFNKNFDTLECCDEDSIEYKIYQKILFEKKQKILKGENEVISNLFGSSSKIIRLLSNYFKEDSKKFEFYGTPIFHHSANAIRLILALDSIENLQRLFNSKISRTSLPYERCFEELFVDDLLVVKNKPHFLKQFTFEMDLPLSTVLEVMNIEEDIPMFYECLNVIYNELYKENKQNFSYSLPEGITEINAHKYPFSYYAEKVRKEAKDKIVYMPSTLKKINGNLFVDVSLYRDNGVSDIRLNEGIKSIGWYSLRSRESNIAVFDIPSTLESCDETSVNLTGSEYLCFNNYKESKLLFNSNELGNLIKNELTAKVLNFIYNGKDRISADVEVHTKTLSKIMLIDNDRLVKTISINDIKCYGRISDERIKQGEYKVSKELARKYASKIIQKVKLEIEKMESKEKTKKKSK